MESMTVNGKQKESRLLDQLEKLLALSKETKKRKIALLQDNPHVLEYLKKNPAARQAFKDLQEEELWAIFSVIAIGQGENVFRGIGQVEHWQKKLSNLLSVLLAVEKFYDSIGGIIGYHTTMLKLIMAEKKDDSQISYKHPIGVNLAEETDQIKGMIRKGIECMPQTAEIFPIGGAGDRLNLKDPSTGMPMPAAELKFLGKTLLEGLIRDLQGKEYLHYKLTGRSYLHPIALMTSEEKDNHRKVIHICRRNDWFGRSQENFCFFTQPLVPVINQEGNWSLSAPLELYLKPGGHGAIWKLALDKGVFEWLREKGCKKALVRQINNPIAGVDAGLLAFSGTGWKGDKLLGFCSCKRRIGAPEGMDILVEKKTPQGIECCITNVEYTDFEIRGLKENPEAEGSPFSAYPCNTNLLFIDLHAIESTARKYPIPGMLINMKKEAPYIKEDGAIVWIPAGRLESTMQNIADEITDIFPKEPSKEEIRNLKTFITFNKRRKTLSVTKMAYKEGGDIEGTPEGCLFTLLKNSCELLISCGFDAPPLREHEEYIKKGPSFIMHYHPALGPSFQVISQKIRGGRLEEGSELVLEIAEADIENLRLKGSFLLQALSPTGFTDKAYTQEGGKCILRNCRIENQGIDYEAENVYWRRDIQRKESLQIILEGNAEFYAENIDFIGNHEIRVPENHKTTAIQEGTKIQLKTEKIKGPSWHWIYTFDESNNIVLKSKKL